MCRWESDFKRSKRGMEEREENLRSKIKKKKKKQLKGLKWSELFLQKSPRTLTPQQNRHQRHSKNHQDLNHLTQVKSADKTISYLKSRNPKKRKPLNSQNTGRFLKNPIV